MFYFRVPHLRRCVSVAQFWYRGTSCRQGTAQGGLLPQILACRQRGFATASGRENFAAQLEAVEESLRDVTSSISSLESKLEGQTPLKSYETPEYLVNEKSQLRSKESQLREEKIILLRQHAECPPSGTSSETSEKGDPNDIAALVQQLIQSLLQTRQSIFPDVVSFDIPRQGPLCTADPLLHPIMAVLQSHLRHGTPLGTCFPSTSTCCWSYRPPPPSLWAHCPAFRAPPQGPSANPIPQMSNIAAVGPLMEKLAAAIKEAVASSTSQAVHTTSGHSGQTSSQTDTATPPLTPDIDTLGRAIADAVAKALGHGEASPPPNDQEETGVPKSTPEHENTSASKEQKSDHRQGSQQDTHQTNQRHTSQGNGTHAGQGPWFHFHGPSGGQGAYFHFSSGPNSSTTGDSWQSFVENIARDVAQALRQAPGPHPGPQPEQQAASNTTAHASSSPSPSEKQGADKEASGIPRDAEDAKPKEDKGLNPKEAAAMSVAELKRRLDAKGIDYRSKLEKFELVDLLLQHIQKPDRR